MYRTSKIVLAFKNKPEELLNGLTTNTLDAPKNAFIDAFARVVAIAYQIKQDDAVLHIIEITAKRALMQHLEKYLKLSKTTVEQLPLAVYWDLGGSYVCGPDEFVLPQQAGQLVLTPNQLETTTSKEEFTAFRVAHNILLQNVDFKKEMILNVDPTFVSFTKGCFLGQEILARIDARSKPPKKLVVKAVADCNESEQQRMTSVSNGRGFVFVKNT